MRAVDCPQHDSEHLHAETDEKLERAVLAHAREAHPDLPFGEDAARRLVHDASYQDSKHGKSKNSWAEFTGRTETGTDLV